MVFVRRSRDQDDSTPGTNGSGTPHGTSFGRNKLIARAPNNSDYIRASLFIVLSVSLFTSSHGFVRGLGQTLHPFEIAFFTSVFSFVFYIPWLSRNGLYVMRTENIRLHLIRALFNAAAVSTWYLAISLTPLADATALALMSPMVVTLAAIFFLGERPRSRRWVALGVGFAGALFIVRPGFASFSIGFLFVLLSISCNSGSKILAKRLLRWEAPAVIGSWLALIQIPITLALAVPFWKWPDLPQFLALIAIGLLVGGAHYTQVIAYRWSEVSALEPFNFVRLIIASLIGFFAFSELPDIWTWIGGAIIIASTSYIAHREALRTRER